MTRPRLVSVIIGTRNRPDTLREALASIRALEGADLAFEILVGDNGDDPRTPDVVAEFGGRYSSTAKYGCPAARNLALREASGEFLAFLDDDDLWLPSHIRPHIALLDERPELSAVFGRIQSVDALLQPLGEPWPTELPGDGDLFKTMLAGYFPQVGGTLVRASLLSEIGLMDEDLIGDSDWDWQLRIARQGRIGFVPVTCVLFRQRPPGSFDDLQLRRMGYTRKIFWRHAWPSRREWRGAKELLRDYFKAVETYYAYFVSSAAGRARAGDRAGALKALAFAFRTAPHRVLKGLVSHSEIQKSARAALFSRGNEPIGSTRPSGDGR